MTETEAVPDISLDPVDLMKALAMDARAIEAAAERLAQQLRLFEGARDGQLGLKLRWEASVAEAILIVEVEMMNAAADPDNRLPASLKARGHKMVEAEGVLRAGREHPELLREHAEMESEIRALEKWIRAKERSSSIRQTILSKGVQ